MRRVCHEEGVSCEGCVTRRVCHEKGVSQGVS